MGRTCCVPGCHANYRSEGTHTTSTFKFPKDSTLRDKWIQAIHRENFAPNKNSVVCARHFSDNLIIRSDTYTKPDGSIITVARGAPKLAPDAVPHIFPNQPAYFTTLPRIKRRCPEERKNEQVRRDETFFSEWMKSDVINDFASFKSLVPEKNKPDSSFYHYIQEDDVVFCKLDFSECPKVVVSFRVCSDLTIEVWHNTVSIPVTQFKFILGKNLKLDRWSKFDCIRNRLSSFSVEKTSINDVLETCSVLINSSLEKVSDDDTKALALKFLSEQLHVLTLNHPRYSPQTLKLACYVFYTNASAYVLLRNTGILCLPSPNYLRQLTVGLGVGTGISLSHVKYLKEKCNLLEEHERVISVLLDEIYVNPKLIYKKGVIQGMSSSSSQEASTVQTFLLTSVFSKNKDVIAFFPVKNMTSQELYQKTLQVLECVTHAGYTVIAFISDNNRVNRNMFGLLSSGSLKCSITNPYSSSQKVFLLFDTVHLLKSIRNNWFNQTDSFQTLIFPKFDSTCEVERACVNHLKMLYSSEKEDIVKMAPGLNKKVLDPSSLEKQKVSLVTNLFHEKNVAALEIYMSKHNCSYSGTKEFLSIIIKWWKIVNVKHPYKGKNLRDPFCNPVYTINDESIQYLKNFITWLERWNNIDAPCSSSSKQHGKLTQETHTALLHTTKTFILMCEYILSVYQPKYILLGKFQTDNLEGRFSQYRQMCGGNYNVSVTQILESEKKLKFVSLLKLHSSKCGAFELKSLPEKFTESVDEKIDEEFEESILHHSDTIVTSEENTMVLVFISGYVAKSVSSLVNCKICMNYLMRENSLQVDFSGYNNFLYLMELTRGGLKWPTDFLVMLGVIFFKVFQALISEAFEEKFLKSCNHQSVLQHLALNKLEEQCYNLFEKCSCGLSLYDLSLKCANIFANIFINNYCKVKNNIAIENKILKKHVKNRKLATY